MFSITNDVLLDGEQAIDLKDLMAFHVENDFILLVFPGRNIKIAGYGENASKAKAMLKSYIERKNKPKFKG